MIFSRKLLLTSVVLALSLSANSDEFIVDNLDQNFEILEGSWLESTRSNGFQGINYLHDFNSGSLKTVQWNINTAESSENIEYEVFANWASHPNSTSFAEYIIYHAGGITKVPANQKAIGISWFSLGTFTNPERVTLSNEGADGYVIADAIKLVSISVSNPIEEPPTVNLQQKSCQWINWGSKGEINQAVCPTGKYVAGHIGTGITTGGKRNFGRIYCCSPQ